MKTGRRHSPALVATKAIPSASVGVIGVVSIDASLLSFCPAFDFEPSALALPGYVIERRTGRLLNDGKLTAQSGNPTARGGNVSS